MAFMRVFGTEVLKLRRSKITWISLLFYLFFGLIAWFVLWIVKNPGAAQGLGLVGQKASFASMGIAADWAGLYTFFAELGMAGGMIVISIVVIYLFGREFADGTAKNMLALPIRRWVFVAAKLSIAAIWLVLLTAFMAAESVIFGTLLGLGPLPPELLARETGNMFVSALVIFALQGLVAWVTLASGGYLAPFGYTVATLIVGNLMIRTEWARWCPWSIVALLGGMMGPRQAGVVLGSALVMAGTFALGVLLCIAHETRADNCQ